MRFHHNSLSIPLSERLRRNLEEYRGRKVALGIRPENIYERRSIGSLDEAAPVTARVEVIEPMGAETYLYLTTGETSIVARLESHVKADLDQHIELLFEMGRSHFFDQQTGRRIV